MSNLYHIFIKAKPETTITQVETTMNLAVDWFRYDQKNWIIYTTSDAKKWYARLKPFVEPGGNIFICKFDAGDYFGYMSKELWGWIEKYKGS